MTARLLAVTAAALMVIPGVAAAQGSPQDVIRSFAEEWADRTSDQLASTFDTGGVLLAYDGREHRDLGRARLVAALDQIRDGNVGGGVRVVRVVPVAGSDDRAFAELIWESVSSGTSEAVERTLYLGLVLHDDRWWINEIRVLS